MRVKRLSIRNTLLARSWIAGLMTLSLVLAACTRTTPTAPTATAAPPTATQPAPTATSLPPTKTPLPPTQTPLPPTSTTATPAQAVIEVQNAASLQVTSSMKQTEARSFTWLPDSQSLALGTKEGVQVFSLAPIKESGSATSGMPNFLTASPDQQELAWSNQEDAIQLWQATPGKQVRTLTGNTGPVTSLAFSPKGTNLASASYNNQVFLWDAASGELLETWDFSSWMSNLSFSPDGTEMAGVSLPDFEIQIWKADSGQPVRKLDWTDQASPALYGAFFSPDWTNVAWVARGTVQIMSVASGELGPTLGHEDFVNGVAWSPDGSLLAVATAATVQGNFQPAVVIWDVDAGKLVNTLVQSSPTLSLSFSPDGRQLATLTSDGALQFWAVAK